MRAGAAWRRASLSLALVAWAAVPVAGQPSGGDAAGAPATDGVRFLAGSAFHLTAEGLAEDDPRFSWDAHFGGEIDFLDYGTGRLTFLADYEVVLGDEIRAFDPNQGNYVLSARASRRVGATEVAVVFYHQSRHLADRAKMDPVDWNAVGGQVRHRTGNARTRLDARADLRRVIQKSLVDYTWELDAAVRGDRVLRPGVGALASAGVLYRGVDGSRDRGGQAGYRLEGGLRFEGRRAALELFVAGERRIDPSPLETGAASWLSAGFRLLSAP